MGEAIDDGEQPGEGQHRAGDVDRRALGGTVVQPDQGADDGDGSEHQVDVEAVPPGQLLGQNPAEDQPHGAAAGGDSPEDPVRLAAITRVSERRGQDRQGGRSEQRGEHALHRPGRDEYREGVRGAADR